MIEKCDVISDNECDIYPILQESPLDLNAVIDKVLEFAEAHPNGMLISGNGRLMEYEVDGAELCCYVDYA